MICLPSFSQLSELRLLVGHRVCPPLSPAISSCLILICSTATAADSRAHEEPPRKVFAHYMANYPVGSGATAYHRIHDAHRPRHDSSDPVSAAGGRWRNWDLVPPGLLLTARESAELEIRRAVRAGLDGFAVNAWAGGESAKAMLAALFEVAEAGDYAFEITICLDANCLEPSAKTGPWGGRFQAHVDAVKLLLERHGNSPKLARRGGKPLIFGYQSVWLGLYWAEHHVNWKIPWNDPALRTTSEAWGYLIDGYREFERQVGEPLFTYFCTSALFHGVDAGRIPPDALEDAAGMLASYFPAVGDFLGGGRQWDRLAQVVRARGAEWSEPLWYQYENIQSGETFVGKGTDVLRERWERARANGSTLIQFTTWNDYTEGTQLAPGYNTRYTLLDLTGYFIHWWKTGREPVATRDRIYLIYRKYPPDAEVYPFRARRAEPGALEVLTILARPGKIRLPGRSAEYEAPAGLHVRQFPLEPGPVIAELVRGGIVDIRLKSPEPITARPFREDNGMVCFSTEYIRHWEADFGDTPPFLSSEYGDDDGDGLPNWFEMYWFGKFLDFSTATSASPDRDSNRDGFTNLEAYLQRRSPLGERPGAE